MEYPKFKVCVRCFTFNQAKYIEDAMNGFVMQQTDFPFVCCIVDDASTDGEQEVIKKYMDMQFDYSPNSVSFEKETDYAYIHYAQHKKNKNCYFAVVFLKMNLYSKKEGFKKFEYISEWRDICEYEAMCEGDDYWISCNKLKKQVDFLDRNQECSMVFHNAEVKKEGNVHVYFEQNTIEDRFYSANEIVKKWIVPTASVLYRNKLDKVKLAHSEWIMFGDIILFLKACRIGPIYGMSDCMSIYRINPKGISQDTTLLKKWILMKPQHYECIKINFGDMLDLKWLDNFLSSIYAQKAAILGLKGFGDLKKSFCLSPRKGIYTYIRFMAVFFLKNFIDIIRKH